MANLLHFPDDPLIAKERRKLGKALMELHKEQQKAESVKRIQESFKLRERN